MCRSTLDNFLTLVVPGKIVQLKIEKTPLDADDVECKKNIIYDQEIIFKIKYAVYRPKAEKFEDIYIYPYSDIVIVSDNSVTIGEKGYFNEDLYLEYIHVTNIDGLKALTICGAGFYFLESSLTIEGIKLVENNIKSEKTNE